MKNNVSHNPHPQRSQSQLPPRQRAFWAIISFAIFKVTKSITIWVLMLLAVLLFNAFLVTLLIISPTYSNFIVNFQYEVIIFSNIFLLIFILLGAIKFYGRELEDGTYLLLISKPYHRLTIFFLKLLALWICLAFFIGLILLTGYLISLVVYHVSLKPIFYLQILKLLVNLLKYTMMLSFLAVNGIICALSIFSSQIVILIVTIFCSLFLLGGLPYSLISTLSNNIEITFTDGGGTYPVSRLRETILFVEDLQDNKIANPVLTKKIYDFYAQDSPSDLQAIINGTDSNLLKKNRLLFYQSLGLTKKITVTFHANKITSWLGTYKNQNINDIISADQKASPSRDTTLDLTLGSDYGFKTSQELNSHNVIDQELLNLIASTKAQTPNWDYYYHYYLNNTNSLMLFNDNTYFTIDNLSYQEKNINPANIFKAIFSSNYEHVSSQYLASPDFIQSLDHYFKNPVFYVVKTLEDNILQKVYDYKILQLATVKINQDWKKYQNLTTVYQLITKFNLLEHWNQIWTTMISYEPYQFQPFANSFIDFDSQKNKLMSYQDFPLVLDAQHKIILQTKNYLKIKTLIYLYLAISICCLLLAIIIIARKSIT